MSAKRKGAALGFVLLLLFLFPCDSHATKGWVVAIIFPGQGVGEIRLGEHYSVISNSLGKEEPDKVEMVHRTVNNEDKMEYWLNYEDRGLQMILNHDKVLIKIIVKNSGLSVKENGIHVGSSEKLIRKIYGEKEAFKKIKGAEALCYPSKGLSFMVSDKTHLVESIVVENKGESFCPLPAP